MGFDTTTQKRHEDERGREPGDDERRQQRPAATSKVVPVLGYLIGGLVLVGYFVWMCSEMASHASNGSTVPISIFGGVLLGIVAGAAGLLTRRRNS